MGVDIGTSSSKGVLCAPVGTNLEQATLEDETSFPRPDWAEHDAETIWWSELVAICRRLLSGRWSGADIGGAAVSAIGPCMLPVDADGRLLRPGVLYRIDSQAQEEIAWVEHEFDADSIVALNGMSPAA
jgi:xylulokinase